MTKMPPKQKKMSLWTKCSACNIEVATKDIKGHTEGCGDPQRPCIVPHISQGAFYTILEHNNNRDCPAPIEGHVLLHYSLINACGLVMGEPVKIEHCDGNLAPVVRRVWPSSNANHLTSAIVLSEDLTNDWQHHSLPRVRIRPFKEPLILAETVLISKDCHCIDNNSFCSYLKYYQRNRIFLFPNNIAMRYLGKHISITLLSVNKNEYVKPFNQIWFICNEQTKWIIENSSSSRSIETEILIAGVDDILNDMFSIMNIALKEISSVSSTKLLKSILLYGPSGTGKTLITKYVTSKNKVNVVNVNTSEIYSKFYGETEAALKKLFDHAIKNNPSIILIDDIDILCPKRSTSGTEQEKRITSTLATLLDSIHDSNYKIFVLCCSSKLDIIDPSLRRFGRIDHEIEVPIPDQMKRHSIFKVMLSNITHNLSSEEVKLVSDAAHGYVGADIANLCTQASMHMLSSVDSRNVINLIDFQWALNHVSPSAMREVLVDVPNVKWCDVGGQEELKLKLKQLVEWPLKYADSFSRLGIKPPSGILMYGPPGCSKTMIAKAVASESRLNFLSIKGPELFSKWVGESERAVRELFRKARQVAPSIIFFDEIDALGSERSKNSSSSNVQERVLAQLLTEMDGITPLGNVTIIAATNRPDKIDSALLRPGRLDRIVYVPLPDELTRKAIFIIKLSKMPHCKSVDLDNLIFRSEGYSGAEITAVCHEAALKALEEDINISEVTVAHFDKAFNIVKPRTPENLLILYKEFGISST